jgi:sugar transferase (PEP-CTERM system associated)
MLHDLGQNGSLDRIIVALSERRGTIPIRELLQLRLKGIKVEDETAVLEKATGKIETDELHPSELIFSDGFQLTRANLFARRVMSVFISVVLLLLVSPLIPLIVLAIKLSSPGPVLYRQARVGRGGVVFHCYKFRTMRPDAEADTGPTWASDEDPRITPIGRFLRRTRLDEIPQLWNVLKGEMGFVGPRPERPEFVEWLGREIPYYSLRHGIRPGITGWAQIRYKYGNTVEDAKEKLKYDLYYIKNVSLGLDLLIMFQTIKIVLLGRGAQ